MEITRFHTNYFIRKFGEDFQVFLAQTVVVFSCVCVWGMFNFGDGFDHINWLKLDMNLPKVISYRELKYSKVQVKTKD